MISCLKWKIWSELIEFQVDDEAMDLNKELMTKLLELDDVDAVYTDQKWSKTLKLRYIWFVIDSIL